MVKCYVYFITIRKILFKMSVIVSFLFFLTAAALVGSHCSYQTSVTPHSHPLAHTQLFSLQARSNLYSWNSTQTVPFSNIQTPELLTGFKIEFHSQPGMQHPMDISNPRIYKFPVGSNPRPGCSTSSSEKYVLMLLPHRGYLPSAHHISSFIQSPVPSPPLPENICWPL